MKEIFDYMDSLDKIVKVFENSKGFVDAEICFAWWNATNKLLWEEQDLGKVISLASRFLKIMTDIDNNSNVLTVPIVENLDLLGFACFKLNKFEESLGYACRAEILLDRLEGDDNLDTVHRVHLLLCNIKNALGRKDEMFPHIAKICEIIEKTSGKDSLEFANTNKQASECYFSFHKFNEALPFCLRAIEIYTKIHGEDSQEVGECRKLVGFIYSAIGETEKGLAQNMSSQSIFNSLGCSSLLLRAEIESSCTLNALGKYEDALKILKGILSKTGKVSLERIMVLGCIAEVFCFQERFQEAKSYADSVCKVLEKLKESDAIYVALGFFQIARVYEKANELETSLSLLMKVSLTVEKLSVELSSHPYLKNLYSRIGELLLLTGRMKEAFPYIIQDDILKLKNSFGFKHYKVGYAYSDLGSVYYDLHELQSAVEAFSNAKDILDESLGPNHGRSLDACKDLCRAYTAMGRYSLAMSILEEISGRLEALGPCAQRKRTKAAEFMSNLLKDLQNGVA